MVGGGGVLTACSWQGLAGRGRASASGTPQNEQNDQACRSQTNCPPSSAERPAAASQASRGAWCWRGAQPAARASPPRRRRRPRLWRGRARSQTRAAARPAAPRHTAPPRALPAWPAPPACQAGGRGNARHNATGADRRRAVAQGALAGPDVPVPVGCGHAIAIPGEEPDRPQAGRGAWSPEGSGRAMQRSAGLQSRRQSLQYVVGTAEGGESARLEDHACQENIACPSPGYPDALRDPSPLLFQERAQRSAALSPSQRRPVLGCEA